MFNQGPVSFLDGQLDVQVCPTYNERSCLSGTPVALGAVSLDAEGFGL